VRQFKKPVKAYKDLATLYPQTNAIFSPDEKYIVTGTASTSRGGHGKLVFIQREDFEVVETVDMASTIVRVVWHSKINQVRAKEYEKFFLMRWVQIVTGMANGQISVLYSPLTSTNGAKLLANKAPPRKAAIEDMSAALLAPTILTPHALPMYRDGDAVSGLAGTKRKREKDRADPRKSRRPELPVSGPGRGGRVGASATQHVVRHLVRDTTRDEDVRVSLFSHGSRDTSAHGGRCCCGRCGRIRELLLTIGCCLAPGGVAQVCGQGGGGSAVDRR